MLKLKNLHVTLGKTVIDNVSFEINRGDFLLLIGANGAGKTTLLKAIAGVHPYSGNIFFNDSDIGNMNRKYLSRMISYQPQRMDFILPISVKDILISGRFPHSRLFRNYGAVDIEVLNRASEKFKISELLDRDINTLSGGERKKVLIASSYIQDVSLFLFDEPLSSLDPKESTDIVDMLKELNKDGKTVVVVTHQISMLLEASTKIAALKKGKLIFSGPKENIAPILSDTFDINFKSINFSGGKLFVPTKNS